MFAYLKISFWKVVKICSFQKKTCTIIGRCPLDIGEGFTVYYDNIGKILHENSNFVWLKFYTLIITLIINVSY